MLDCNLGDLADFDLQEVGIVAMGCESDHACDHGNKVTRNFFHLAGFAPAGPRDRDRECFRVSVMCSRALKSCDVLFGFVYCSPYAIYIYSVLLPRRPTYYKS